MPTRGGRSDPRRPHPGDHRGGALRRRVLGRARRGLRGAAGRRRAVYPGACRGPGRDRPGCPRLRGPHLRRCSTRLRPRGHGAQHVGTRHPDRVPDPLPRHALRALDAGRRTDQERRLPRAHLCSDGQGPGAAAVSVVRVRRAGEGPGPHRHDGGDADRRPARRDAPPRRGTGSRPDQPRGESGQLRPGHKQDVRGARLPRSAGADPTSRCRRQPGWPITSSRPSWRSRWPAPT